jgi:hypothetical protein
MNKNIIVLLLIVVIAFGAYVLFATDDGSAPVTPETATSTTTQTDAETPAQTVPVISDYTGMTVAEAESVAAKNNTTFRVVEIDGEPQMVTEDYRIGRINAVVADGVVISYSIEGENVAEKPPVEKTEGQTNPYFIDNDMAGEMPVQNPPEDTDPNNHDEIIGMTTPAAKGYARTNEVDFRIGKVDGEAMMVTSDFKPGRITAEIEKDVVVGYSVE